MLCCWPYPKSLLQCLDASKIYRALRHPPTNPLTPLLFNNASTIIASYLVDLYIRCDEDADLIWDTVSYSHFAHELLHLDDAFDVVNHTHDDQEDEYLSVGQLESLLRVIAGSYLPGDDWNKTIIEEVRLPYVQTGCAFGAINVS